MKIAGLLPRLPPSTAGTAYRGENARRASGCSSERVEEQRPAAATFGFIDSNWPESRVGRARVRVPFLPFAPSLVSHLFPSFLLSPSFARTLSFSLLSAVGCAPNAFRDGLFAQRGIRISRSSKGIKQDRGESQ